MTCCATSLVRLSFREVGAQLRVDHPAGGHDDHVIAVGLGLLALTQAAAVPAPYQVVGVGPELPSDHRAAIGAFFGRRGALAR